MVLFAGMHRIPKHELVLWLFFFLIKHIETGLSQELNLFCCCSRYWLDFKADSIRALSFLIDSTFTIELVSFR